MSNRKTKLLTWSMAFVWIMACAPSVTTSSLPPTLDPGVINTYIAQTANAASTQTVAAIPTITQTETFTPTPRGTNTPEPTITETIIVTFDSPTVFASPTPTNTFDPISKKDYACKIIDSPTDGIIYDPRVEFTVRWKVRNVGRLEWDRTVVGYEYLNGDKFHKVDRYDLSKTTGIGVIVELVMDMRAPKNPGTYTTRWTMAANSEKFCKLELSIRVR